MEVVMTSRSVVFAEPVRTAISTFGGSLKDMPDPDLGATAIRSAVARAGVCSDEVETVVMGNVVEAGTKMNPARQAAVDAGLPVTALTANRVCGSGAQAIVSAAQEISLGNINAAVAGGMENMDQAPYLVARGRWGDPPSWCRDGWPARDCEFCSARASMPRPWTHSAWVRFTSWATIGAVRSHLLPRCLRAIASRSWP
jgi:acetyl-CoA acetyltransferase